jgi:hypothetical protein
MLLSLLNVTGERTEAVLLAIGDSRMRVVIRGLNDTAELRFIKDQWIFENGVPVDIESLIAIPATNWERPAIDFNRALDSGKPLRTMTAGS